MSDAPERLWMFKDVLKPFLPGGGKINMGDTEYIRADLYDALRTENERLREALRKIAGGGVPAQSAFWQWHDRYQDQRDFARAALETKGTRDE